MAFSTIFKKATSFLGFGSSLKPPPLDGEIIYCKNNVCVHPPATLTSDKEEHHQGYLTLRSHQDKGSGPTLILTWIPNSTLRKNTRSIENSPNRSNGTTPRTSPRRVPRQEFAKSDDTVVTPSTSRASMSPLDSCVSIDSEYGDMLYNNMQKKMEAANANCPDNVSINSDLSPGSKDESFQDGTPDEEGQRKLSTGSTSRSQSDSGIVLGASECVQNNVKRVQSLNKDKKVGTNVNMLYSENLNKFNADLTNLTKAALDDESLSSTTESDSLTNEEKLAAMLNKHKLHKRTKERTDSNRSVSIEMEGDSITVVTEDLDDEVLMDTKDLSLEERNLNKNESKFESSSSQSTEQDLTSLSSDSAHASPSGNHYSKMISDVRSVWSMNSSENSGSTIHNSSDTLTDRSGLESRDSTGNIPPQSLNLNNNTSANTQSVTSLPTPDISVTRQRSESGSSTTTSGPDSNPPSPFSSSPPSSSAWEQGLNIDSPSSCDSFSHNLTFPENALSKGRTSSGCDREKKTAKEQVCGVFSVDLGQMRSLRLFYNDAENTKGQIVIASRESQYKILHFHNGGLDKLAEIFQDWSLFATAHEKTGEPDKTYRQFMIVKPQLTDDQCHPEEGIYTMVNEDIWRTHMMDDGVIEDDYQLRKAIFFGGIEPSLRHEAWPFLLHYLPFDSSFEEREQIRNDRYIEYQNIRKKRDAMLEDQRETFWKTVQCTVEKDVVRTDRSHPYFKGENNPNIEVLQNILLNYAVANPELGYTQGMSDLLAPVLAEIQNEVDTYWCFEGLMQRTIFVSSPKDSDMDRQLNYLRGLLKMMQPTFYDHLEHLGDDAMELLFCHRWILLCFKREFHEKDALRIWEACWAHYQTDYFHLFICVAIVCIYGEDVVEQYLAADEILLHFSSLACHMSGEVVLRKARGLLHDYRKRPVIPCTLHGLCSLCGQGMWDSGHVPMVQCVENHGNERCPYLSQPNTPSPVSKSSS